MGQLREPALPQHTDPGRKNQTGPHLPQQTGVQQPAQVFGARAKAGVDALVEEATVDCYGEYEQLTGLFT